MMLSQRGAQYLGIARGQLQQRLQAFLSDEARHFLPTNTQVDSHQFIIACAAGDPHIPFTTSHVLNEFPGLLPYSSPHCQDLRE